MNKIIINPNDQQEYNKYVKIRGEKLYQFVAYFICEHTNKDTIDYKVIASAMKYDKRLKNVLYKYLGIIEDSLKSIIYKRAHYDFKKHHFFIDDSYDDYSSFQQINSTHKFDFNDLIHTLEQLKFNDIDFKLLDKIRAFRNKVMHFNFLLLHYDNDGNIQDNRHYLQVNILHIYEFLYTDFQKPFLTELKNVEDQLENIEMFKLNIQI